VSAGRVGRAHGLDGSFYVTGARSRLLEIGTMVAVAGSSAPVVRLAGTEEHPIVRLGGIEERARAEAIRGQELTVALEQAPVLGEGEWWASELEGCEVVDGERHVGVVARLVELPSCEALEVRLAISGGDNEDASASGTVGGRGRELLVPMVRDAIRQIDVARQRIDVDMSFLGDM
jgi:16S rRNA processing protein RimM